MQLDLLNASVCRIIAGGDRHCGGHPSRSMQDGHRNANIHMWIGAKNVTARFHYDHAENTFVQFWGESIFFWHRLVKHLNFIYFQLRQITTGNLK